MNLMMLLEMAQAGDPERMAVCVAGQRGLTVAELAARASSAAADLRRRGVDGVVYIGTNALAFPVVVFAAASAGVPLIPLNYRLGAEQLSGLLERHASALVIADGAVAGLSGQSHQSVEMQEWLASTDPAAAAMDWPDDPDAVATLLYTSGTTAAPKAAILRHRHLMAYVLGSVDFASAAASDSALVAVPPYHVAGVANLVTNLYAGRRIVYLDSFTPQHWLEVARWERVTHAMVVPTMLTRIVGALDGAVSAQVPTLRALSYGGSRIPPSVVARAIDLFPGTDFVNAYGLTETSSTIAVLSPDDHRSAAASGDPAVTCRLGSVGRLIPGIEAEIRDQAGNLVPCEVPGELWLRGAQISGEYLGAPSSIDESGWFPTRDRAHFDREGYLYIEGRADDTIIRGGENTSPAEIEDVLIQHPAVADVAVVGVADDEWGQRIAAVVVPGHGATLNLEDLRTFARARLRSSRTPDQIEVWPSLPYTDSGKLLRRAVQTELEKQSAS